MHNAFVSLRMYFYLLIYLFMHLFIYVFVYLFIYYDIKIKKQPGKWCTDMYSGNGVVKIHMPSG